MCRISTKVLRVLALMILLLMTGEKQNALNDVKIIG